MTKTWPQPSAPGVQRWLEERVAIQLRLGNQWLQDRAVEQRQGVKPDLDSAWEGLYENTGSCLFITDTIHPARNGRLQVVKEHPLTLTDGAVYVEAKWTAACERRFYRQSQSQSQSRHPSPPRENSVFAARTYTIRFTPYGPPRERLHLILNTIDPLGAGERGAFDALVPLISSEKVSIAARELQDTQEREDCRCCGLDIGREHHTMSQLEPLMDEEGMSPGSPDTQAAFGTQLVHPYRSRPADHHVQFLGVNRMEPVLGGSTRREELRPSDLLSLIHRSRPPDTAQQSALSAGGFARNPAHSQNASSEKPQASSRGLSTPESQQRLRHGVVHEPQLQTPTNRARNWEKSPQVDQTPMLYAEMDTEPQATEGNPLTRQFQVSSDDGELRALDPAWMNEFHFTHDFTKTSQEQQSLLLKPECWQRPSPGYRFPDANVPIRILIALNEHAEETAGAEESSDEELEDEDAALPGAGNREVGMHDAEDDVEADIPSSEVSWSRSPTPEPPKRPTRMDQLLPPDSSLGDRDIVGTVSDVQRPNLPAEMLQQPVIIESSNEMDIVHPTSSPPYVVANEDSDEDMGLEVTLPRALGEDQSATQRVSVPRFTATTCVVQVKETPYTKGKNGYAVPLKKLPESMQQQTSSGSSKDTSSTSIVYGTYKEPNSSGDGHVPTGKRSPGTSHEESNMRPPGADTSAHVQKPVRFPPTVAKNVSMPDAPSDSPRSSKQFQSQTAVADLEDQEMPLAPPEPSPMSAQIPPKELSSSGEPTVEVPNGQNEAQPQSMPAAGDQAATLGAAHMKRKLVNSPSKKSNRLSKRREIKIVNFGDDSPVEDLAAAIHKFRKESMERFLEGRRSDTLRKSPTSAVPDEREVVAPAFDAQAGAESGHMDTRRQSNLPKQRSPFHSNTNATSMPQPGAHIPRPQSPLDRNVGVSDVSSFMKPGKLGSAHGKSLEQRGAFEVPDTRQETGLNKEPKEICPSRREQFNPLATNEEVSSHSEMDIDEVFEDYNASKDALDGPDQQFSKYGPDPPPIPSQRVIETESKSRVSMKASIRPTEPGTIFQRFKETYPEYTGDARHFMGQCKQMLKLEGEDKMVPKWQWDDFIIRNRTDYKTYVVDMTDQGEDAEPYHRFYKNQIRDTRYRKGIVESRATLITALEQLGGAPSTTGVVVEPQRKASRQSLPAPEAAVEHQKKPKKRSLPWAPSQSNDHTPNHAKPPKHDRPRQSLPARPVKEAPLKRLSAPSGGIFHAPSKSNHSTPSASRKGAPSGASTPNLRRPGAFSSLSRLVTETATRVAPLVPTEPTGDPYRDFVFAQQRVTSWTGSNKVDLTKAWPANLAVRPVAGVEGKEIDVLNWKDEL